VCVDKYEVNSNVIELYVATPQEPIQSPVSCLFIKVKGVCAEVSVNNGSGSLKLGRPLRGTSRSPFVIFAGYFNC